MPPADAGLGTRGGPIPPNTVERANALFQEWKAHEYGKLRTTILMTAYEMGEFHADALADIPLSQRNMIGANVRALVAQRLLASTGEHRKGQSAASHGRRSYVYRLTAEGIAVAKVFRHKNEALIEAPNERLFT